MTVHPIAKLERVERLLPKVENPVAAVGPLPGPDDLTQGDGAGEAPGSPCGYGPGAVAVCENCAGLFPSETLGETIACRRRGGGPVCRCPVCGVAYEAVGPPSSAADHLQVRGLVLTAGEASLRKSFEFSSIGHRLAARQLLPVPALLLCLDLAEQFVHVAAEAIAPEFAQRLAQLGRRATVKVLSGPNCEAQAVSFLEAGRSGAGLERRVFAPEGGYPPGAALVVVDGLAALHGPPVLTRTAWTPRPGGEGDRSVRLTTDRGAVTRAANHRFAVHWDQLGGRIGTIHLDDPR